MTDLTRKTNFVLQQGLEAPPAQSCSIAYSGLLFQPRVIGVIVIVAAIAQSVTAFAALGATLLWSAAFPRWNPFDAAYNRLFASRSVLFRLSPAPPPRRFAQSLAGSLSMLIATLLMLGHIVAAIVVEVILVSAIAALVFGGFCFGSYVFHLLKGRKAFAHRTLPWSAPPDSA